MTARWDLLAERQMLKARAQGALDDLEGQGRKLPDRPGDVFVSAGDAAGMRIMAQAGVVPEEIALKEALETARAELRGTEGEARVTAMARIADLEMRLNVARDARRRFLKD